MVESEASVVDPDRVLERERWMSAGYCRPKWSPRHKGRPIPLASIEAAVLAVFGVGSEDLRGNGRSPLVVAARRTFFAAARRMTDASYPELAAHIRNRPCHSTAITGERAFWRAARGDSLWLWRLVLVEEAARVQREREGGRGGRNGYRSARPWAVEPCDLAAERVHAEKVLARAYPYISDREARLGIETLQRIEMVEAVP